MNNFSCTGNFVRDPELVTLSSGTKKIKFSLAINNKRSKNKEAVFCDFEAWDTAAEFVEKHFHKGDKIIISNAELRQDRWDDKEGNKRSKLYFRVNDFEFPGGNRNNQQPAEEEAETVSAGSNDNEKEPF